MEYYSESNKKTRGGRVLKLKILSLDLPMATTQLDQTVLCGHGTKDKKNERVEGNMDELDDSFETFFNIHLDFFFKS